MQVRYVNLEPTCSLPALFIMQLTVMRSYLPCLRHCNFTDVTTLLFEDVFWVAPCSLVEVYRRFRGTCSLHHQGDDDGGSKYCQLLTIKALTMAVWANVVGGTYGPCQKYKALTLHSFSLYSPV
jgi:hypothetical protein